MIATAAAIAAPPLADVVVRWAHERIDGRPPNGADQTLFGERDAPIARLSRIFGLTGDEMRLVALALADDLDARLPARWADLEWRRGWPRLTLEVAARVLEATGEGWAPDCASFRWLLLRRHEIEPGLSCAVSLDPCIREWLLGRSQIAEPLVPYVGVERGRDPLPSWPVADAAAQIGRLLEDGPATRVRCLVEGTAGSGRVAFAQAVAARFGMPLIVVGPDASGLEMWVLAERQAFLDRCAIGWVAPGFTPPHHLLPFPLQFGFIDERDAVEPQPYVVDIRVAVPPPTADERAALWRTALPGWPADDVDRLAQRHRLTLADISYVSRQRPASPSIAARLLRERSRGRLHALAQRVDCPFSMDDLVVSPPVRDALEDLAFEAAHRVTFWERDVARRMFPQGRALVALLSGAPGTGKTMAAQVIAAALDIDLYRIDLSAIVSKWVGETAQNIERLLADAATLDIVLLFDEADALFAKRSTEVRDANDKFANMDASHLLTAIENYPGIVLLTTNLRGNIDQAFVRRMRFIIDFAKPDLAQRTELWRRCVSGLAGAGAAERLAADLPRLAESVEATGAEIKYAVLAAVFRAQREGAALTMAHLVHGLNRELSKEGRALAGREARRLTGELT